MNFLAIRNLLTLKALEKHSTTRPIQDLSVPLPNRSIGFDKRTEFPAEESYDIKTSTPKLKTESILAQLGEDEMPENSDGDSDIIEIGDSDDEVENIKRSSGESEGEEESDEDSDSISNASSKHSLDEVAGDGNGSLVHVSTDIEDQNAGPILNSDSIDNTSSADTDSEIEEITNDHSDTKELHSDSHYYSDDSGPESENLPNENLNAAVLSKGDDFHVFESDEEEIEDQSDLISHQDKDFEHSSDSDKEELGVKSDPSSHEKKDFKYSSGSDEEELEVESDLISHENEDFEGHSHEDIIVDEKNLANGKDNNIENTKPEDIAQESSEDSSEESITISKASKKKTEESSASDSRDSANMDIEPITINVLDSKTPSLEFGRSHLLHNNIGFSFGETFVTPSVLEVNDVSTPEVYEIDNENHINRQTSGCESTKDKSTKDKYTEDLHLVTQETESSTLPELPLSTFPVTTIPSVGFSFGETFYDTDLTEPPVSLSEDPIIETGLFGTFASKVWADITKNAPQYSLDKNVAEQDLPKISRREDKESNQLSSTAKNFVEIADKEDETPVSGNDREENFEITAGGTPSETTECDSIKEQTSLPNNLDDQDGASLPNHCGEHWKSIDHSSVSVPENLSLSSCNPVQRNSLESESPKGKPKRVSQISNSKHNWADTSDGEDEPNLSELEDLSYLAQSAFEFLSKPADSTADANDDGDAEETSELMAISKGEKEHTNKTDDREISNEERGLTNQQITSPKIDRLILEGVESGAPTDTLDNAADVTKSAADSKIDAIANKSLDLSLDDAEINMDDTITEEDLLEDMAQDAFEKLAKGT